MTSPTTHPAAWRGTQLFERDDWLLTLSDEDNAELRAAVQSTRSRAIDELDRQSFELPRLAARLARVQDKLETGSGAMRMRGLELDGLTDDALERLFYGLAAHIGQAVSQSASAERVLHVRDEGFNENDARFRGPYSNKRLRFHSDRCDVIGFLCVRPARAGGENDVISSVTLRAELERRFPDDLAQLEGLFPYLRHVVDPANERPFVQLPVFSEHEGHFACSLLRVLIDRADRSPEAPDLTDAQRAALDRLDEVADDSSLYARLRLERGELLFLNNWVTLHRRTAFEDARAPELRRHVMRVWLAVPNSRPLAPVFGAHFGATAAGAVRGGIHPVRG